LIPTYRLANSHTLDKNIAVNWCVGDRASYSATAVENNVEPTFIGVLCHEGFVVVVVSFVIKSEHDVVQACVRRIIPRVKCQANKKGI